MKPRLVAILIGSLILLSSCSDDSQPDSVPLTTPQHEISVPTPDIPDETPAPAIEQLPLPTPVQEKYPEIEIPYMDSELVRIIDFAPDILIDLRYATEENFTGKIIYGFSDAYIRYGTLKKLISVQEELVSQGYSLLIWDAYRPQQAQFILWDAVPNASFVANPYIGHSSHSNGGTLDLCLVKSDGTTLEMPSAFDEFNSLADRNYSDVSAAAAENALILERAMSAAGFSGYINEWWHYSDPDNYPYDDVEDIIIPEQFSLFYTASCDEYINLRSAADYNAESIAQIPAGAEMKFLAYAGEFLHVQYGDLHGYVAAEYTNPVNTEES